MDISLLFFFFLIIIPSAIIHEYSHGAVADLLGDPTAKNAGRLTLNPLAHIDLFGTILLPLLLLPTGFMFAYAKPVPYNPHNLNNKKWGPALVGVAGPASNLLVAAVFGMLIRFLPDSAALDNFALFVSLIVYANVLLAVFNLVPIPPLDGSKLLFALLPSSLYGIEEFLQRYGIFILFAFLFFGFQFIIPIISGIFTLLVGQPFV